MAASAPSRPGKPWVHQIARWVCANIIHNICFLFLLLHIHMSQCLYCATSATTGTTTKNRDMTKGIRQWLPARPRARTWWKAAMLSTSACKLTYISLDIAQYMSFRIDITVSSIYLDQDRSHVLLILPTCIVIDKLVLICFYQLQENGSMSRQVPIPAL